MHRSRLLLWFSVFLAGCVGGLATALAKNLGALHPVANGIVAAVIVLGVTGAVLTKLGR